MTDLELACEASLSAEGWQKKYGEIRSELEALKESMRWIPVTEREPEGDGSVLAAMPDHGGMHICSAKWVRNMAQTTRLSGAEFVTHWQPLPAPPREG